MSSITITVDIETLKEAEALQNIQNVINTFTKVVLSVDVMRRGANPVRINFAHGEYVSHTVLTQDEIVDTVFDLLGLPVQLIEGYRKITVKTSYQYGFIHSDYHAKINKNLTKSLPVYMLAPPKVPATNVRVGEVGETKQFALSTESPTMTLVGYTSGEVNDYLESKELWFKPKYLEPSSTVTSSTGFLLFKLDSGDDNLVTGILLT